MLNTRNLYYIPADTFDEIDGYVISTPEGERLYTREVYPLALDVLDGAPDAFLDTASVSVSDVRLIGLLRMAGWAYPDACDATR